MQYQKGRTMVQSDSFFFNELNPALEPGHPERVHALLSYMYTFQISIELFYAPSLHTLSVRG